MRKLLSICLAALLVLSLAGCGKTSVVGITTTSKAPAANEESQGVGTHHAEIDIQDYGTITVELDGDPNGNGTGGSENTIKGEFSANGVENSLSHTRGAISMARSQAYDSASSQFFICHADSTFLDGQYACFGYVTDGMDVVDAVCEAAQPTDDNGTIPADQQPVITAIRITD